MILNSASYWLVEKFLLLSNYTRFFSRLAIKGNYTSLLSERTGRLLLILLQAAHACSTDSCFPKQQSVRWPAKVDTRHQSSPGYPHSLVVGMPKTEWCFLGDWKGWLHLTSPYHRLCCTDPQNLSFHSSNTWDLQVYICHVRMSLFSIFIVHHHSFPCDLIKKSESLFSVWSHVDLN